MIIGPNLGGWMIDAFEWRSIFWFNVPLGILVLTISAFILPPGHREKGQIDLTGAGLFTGSLFAFMIGLSEMGNSDNKLSWVVSGLLLAAGIAFMLAFIRRESRIKNPIIDLEVLKGRPFMAANIYNFVFGASVISILSFVPLYATSLYRMTTLESGLILTPRSIGMMVASTVTSILLVKWGYRWPMLVGTISIVLSLFLLGIETQGINIFGLQVSSVVILVMIMLLSGAGLGVVAPAANNVCLELMPNRIATITGVRGMFRLSGGAIAIAITSLLLHNIGDMARGFTVAFLGLGIVLLLTIPLIFAMPRGPEAPVPAKETKNQGN